MITINSRNCKLDIFKVIVHIASIHIPSFSFLFFECIDRGGLKKKSDGTGYWKNIFNSFWNSILKDKMLYKFDIDLYIYIYREREREREREFYKMWFHFLFDFIRVIITKHIDILNSFNKNPSHLWEFWDEPVKRK